MSYFGIITTSIPKPQQGPQQGCVDLFFKAVPNTILAPEIVQYCNYKFRFQYLLCNFIYVSIVQE